MIIVRAIQTCLLISLIIGTIVAHGWDPTGYCRAHYQSEREPRTCLDYLCKGRTYNGVYNIYPTGFSDFSLPVYCDQTSDGGGWTVFQRRMAGSVDFFRNWASYKLGFGALNSEHWLGNENLHILTNLHRSNELRVELEAENNERTFAHYGNFSVASEADGYRLTVTHFLGTSLAGDAMARSNGMRFSTKDRDQDAQGHSCSQKYKGGWWYKDCHDSNLNGLYLKGQHESFADGVNWKQWKGYHESLTFTEMKFRPAIVHHVYV